jgi:hypothetical protein
VQSMLTNRRVMVLDAALRLTLAQTFRSNQYCGTIVLWLRQPCQ